MSMNYYLNRKYMIKDPSKLVELVVPGTWDGILNFMSAHQVRPSSHSEAVIES
jgi:hypothetical protein